MGRRHFMRGVFTFGWLLACALTLGCNKPAASGNAVPATSASAPAATSGAPASDPRVDELMSALRGVWSRPSRKSEVKQGVVYMMIHDANHDIRITYDGDALDMQKVGADLNAGTVTYHFTNQSAGQQLVFQQPRTRGETRILPVEWYGGEVEEFVFVRPLTQADQEAIEAAYERGPIVIASAGPNEPEQTAAGWTSTVDCNAATTFRARTVCKNEELLRMDRAMAGRFEKLTDEGADIADTQAAAIKQLDACNNSECVRKVYEDWSKYLDENHPVAK